MSAPRYDEFLAKLAGGDAVDLGGEHLRLANADLRPASESVAAVGGAGDTSGLAPKLEKITSKGLDKANQILELPLDPDNPETFGPTLRAQTAIRYSDLEAAARAYHALRQTLDLGRLPYRLDTQSSQFIWMSDAVLTAAAAETIAGQDAAEFLRKRGVIVSDKPIETRSIEEFWHSQILNDARA